MAGTRLFSTSSSPNPHLRLRIASGPWDVSQSQWQQWLIAQRLPAWLKRWGSETCWACQSSDQASAAMTTVCGFSEYWPPSSTMEVTIPPSPSNVASSCCSCLQPNTLVRDFQQSWRDLASQGPLRFYVWHDLITTPRKPARYAFQSFWHRVTHNTGLRALTHCRTQHALNRWRSEIV